VPVIKHESSKFLCIGVGLRLDLIGLVAVQLGSFAS
jgi:hypothetical protein